jgi:hypothetical protein
MSEFWSYVTRLHGKGKGEDYTLLVTWVESSVDAKVTFGPPPQCYIPTNVYYNYAVNKRDSTIQVRTQNLSFRGGGEWRLTLRLYIIYVSF